MKNISIIAIVLFSWMYIHSINISAQTRELKFEHLTIEEGLSQSTVFTIHQDSKGFMWFGTSDGLNKYDGYKFTVYKPDKHKKKSLSSGYINEIFEDSKKRLWIGTRDGGLNLFDSENECFISLKTMPDNPNSLPDNTVYVVYETSDGALWIATNAGISKMDYENGKFNFTNYKHSPNDSTSLSHNYVRSIYEDKAGFLWIGTFTGGLNKMDRRTGKFTNYQNIPGDTTSIIDGQVKAVFEDSYGAIWIGTENGLNRFDRKTETFHRYIADVDDLQSISSNPVYSIVEDKWKNLWVGTYGGGLNLYNRKDDSFIHYQNNPSLKTSLIHNRIWDLFIDQSGVLWIGTLGGVSKYDRNKEKFAHQTYIPGDNNSLSHKWVWAFSEDLSGNIWVGTQKGLSVFDKQTQSFKNYYYNPNDTTSLSHNSVKAIWIDNDGTVWVGTRGGLNKFMPESKSFLRYENNPNDSTSINHNDVRALLRDHLNNLWIGTLDGGLDLFDEKNNRFIHYSKDHNDTTTISNNAVWTVFEDSKGRLWAGTFGGGLNLFDRETHKFMRFQNTPDCENCISDNNVRSIREDSKGMLWIGTSNGLNRFNPETNEFKIFQENDGLPNNVVYGVLVDKHDNIWLSTNRGLVNFIPDENEFKTYTEKDGLQSNEFNGGAYYKSKSGQMFFGGINGFNLFYPDSIFDNSYKPNVEITDFLIFNKSVPIGENANGRVILSKSISETDQIKLLYTDYSISFEFTALHFSSPKKNQYSYFLEGLDENWIFTGADKRFATYTSLPPGDYTFKVKGSNCDGIWSDDIASVKITVLPPFWNTWWFKLLVAAFIILSGFFWYKARIYRIEAQKRILEQQVKERTAEVVQQKEKVEQSYKNVKLLSEIGKEITGTFSVEKIIETDYANLNTLMDASIFAIGIHNQISNSLEFPGTFEKNERLEFYSYTLTDENRIAVKCFKTNQEIIINNFQNEYKNYIQSIKTPVAGETPMSIIYLPLIVKEKTVGVVTVQSFNANVFTPYHVDIIRNLAVYTAIAIDNANAYKAIEQKNNRIEKIAEELATQAETLQETNNALNKEREQTMGSIRYALTIQKAILPVKQEIDEYFKSFIIYRPKDIVSGDFYWVSSKNDFIFAGVIDCTGHGVPGAFMSMIGNRILNEMINQREITSPAEILENMDLAVKKALRQEQTENDDGMDVCLCRIEKNNGAYNICFAGAKRPLFYKADDKKLEIIKGERRSIGGKYQFNIEFKEHCLLLNKSDVIYLSTDGLIDQNAPDRKKFGTQRLVSLLDAINHLSLDEQKQKIEKQLDSHQKDEPQRDDITLMGIKVM